jgi:DNA ligase (NAD+)
MQESLKNLLQRAAETYYNGGSPILTDNEFDTLAALIEYNEVGAKALENKIPHATRLWSLNKVHDEVDVPNTFTVKTPKLDGCAVALYYQGNLVQAATRGDGIEGRNIFDKAVMLGNKGKLPLKIADSEFQVVGEIVATKDVSNARNFASGALNLKDLSEFSTRIESLHFVAYGMSPCKFGTYEEDMKYLQSLGFETVLSVDSSIFPTDGYVYRISSNFEFDLLGYTAKAPRGAVALKPPSDVEVVTTTLNEVVWQLGPSGKVTPVANFDPVVIDDAVISRATLHNMGFVEGHKFFKGCNILVTRSGGIIPKVLENLDLNSAASECYNIFTIEQCPSCGGDLDRVKDQLYCRSSDCTNQNTSKIVKYAKVMGIKGLGSKTVEALKLLDIKDIYELSEEELCDVLGSKTGTKIYEQIIQSLSTKVGTLLSAFSIPLAGATKTAKYNSCKTMEEVLDLIDTMFLVDQNVATWIEHFWDDYKDIPWSFNTDNLSVNSYTVCVTGKLDGYTKASFAEKVKAYGVSFSDNLTSKVNYLIKDDDKQSEKTRKAADLGIEILTSKSFINLLENE